MKSHSLLLPLCLAFAACGTPPENPFGDRPVATGLVTGEGGNPVPGVFVTRRTADSLIAVSVTTDAGGRYAIPADESEHYTLSAHGLGVQPSSITATGPGTHVLEVEPADPYPQQPAARFLSLLPDGEVKRRFILDCTGCHQFDRKIVDLDGVRRSRESWIERINQMISFAGGSSQFPIMSPSRNAEETADWLVSHLNAEHSEDTVHPNPRPAGSVGQATITEYPIPVQADLPHDIAIDQRGHVLVTGMFTHLLYDLDPTTGVFDTLGIPVQYANPRAVAIDSGNRIWALLGFPRQIARYDPATGDWASFEIGMYPHSIVPDDAGRVWFNGHFSKDPELIGVLDAETGEVTTFEVPVPAMPDSGSNIPYGLRRGPDGTIWGTQLVGNRLVRFDPDAQKFSTYPLPVSYSGPRRPDVAPDGTVWIPEYATNRVAAFDPRAETFREYELPIRDSLPYIVRVHLTTGMIWIATAAADAVFRLDPESGDFTTYHLPSPRSLVRHMEVDPESDGVWVAYGNSPSVTPKVARIVPWGS